LVFGTLLVATDIGGIFHKTDSEIEIYMHGVYCMILLGKAPGGKQN
jgi:hypothetical protein